MWADRYDRDLEDIFEIQEEITLKIVRELELKFSGRIIEGFFDKFLLMNRNTGLLWDLNSFV